MSRSQTAASTTPPALLHVTALLAPSNSCFSLSRLPISTPSPCSGGALPRLPAVRLPPVPIRWYWRHPNALMRHLSRCILRPWGEQHLFRPGCSPMRRLPVIPRALAFRPTSPQRHMFLMGHAPGVASALSMKLLSRAVHMTRLCNGCQR